MPTPAKPAPSGSALREPEEVRQQLAWALGMWKKHGHPYDAGYADALAWALGQPAPSKAPEGIQKDQDPSPR